MSDRTPNKDEKTVLPTIFQAVNKNALILAIFALVSTGLIAVTHLLTKDKIAKEIELSLIRQLSQIVPKDKYTNDVYQDCVLVADPNLLGGSDRQKLYRMRSNDKNFGLMITTIAPDGYSGKITLALATSVEGNILGVNILSHNETPGLGDKIERNKSSWLEQFVGFSLSNSEKKDWTVRKDGGRFDALTGATITPRAVVSSIYKGLVYMETNNKVLFDSQSNCYETAGNNQ